MAINVITKISRIKMAEARYSKGTIAKIAEIALGTGGVDENGVVKPHSEMDTELFSEIIRRPYDKAEKVSDVSYEYVIHLCENELIGNYISELVLIDEEGDPTSFSSFLPQGKDEAEAMFSIVDIYGEV